MSAGICLISTGRKRQQHSLVCKLFGIKSQEVEYGYFCYLWRTFYSFLPLLYLFEILQ